MQMITILTAAWSSVRFDGEMLLRCARLVGIHDVYPLKCTFSRGPADRVVAVVIVAGL